MADPRTITLADGRALCFARYGAPDGRPVLYCHGAGSSRLEGEIYDREARAAGVQIVAADRPGCGRSSPRRQWTYSSYAADLAALADQLRIDRFVVAGMSNGGAYAMAAAASLPERVTAVIAINATTPVRDPIARRVTPLAVRSSYAFMRHLPRLGMRLAARSLRNARGPLAPSALESLRQPASGYLLQELRLASSDWGFDHLSIRQPVDLFTGDRDGGYRYAQLWAQRLPSARLHVFPGGHGDFVAPEARARIVAAMASAR